MSLETCPPAVESAPKKEPKLRLGFLVIVLFLAAIIAWAVWPPEPVISPHELSRADGKPRFRPTTLPTIVRPTNLNPPQLLVWEWRQYRRRHAKPSPTAYSFPARPSEPHSIFAMLNQCMDVCGTQYLIAVEIAGGIEFGTTNTLSGAQWVAACEQAIETSGPVVCYDYAKKRNFSDKLLVVRDTPGIVKLVPRTKLAEYRKAGLVKGDL